jgi:hypothetical protein
VGLNLKCTVFCSVTDKCLLLPGATLDPLLSMATLLAKVRGILNSATPANEDRDQEAIPGLARPSAPQPPPVS